MKTQYLVIGGGMTADAAVKALNRADPDGRTLLVSLEPQPPYKRPPLSKGLWKGEDEARADLGTVGTGADMLLGRQVEALDLNDNSVKLDDGTVISYERLLLATGARARNLPSLAGVPGVVAYRTWADYQQVKSAVGDGTRVVVIGGGFIGSEMAAALTNNGAAVTMVFPEAHLGGGRFPASIGQLVDADYRERGVQLVSGRSVKSAEAAGGGVWLVLDDGSGLAADLVLVGVGAVPNDELAKSAGLRTDNGVVVDAGLRAMNASGTVANVYAAGDVANFEWAALGRRLRIEHEDNAYSMGSAAGRFMAAAALGEGADSAPAGGLQYDHLPFFYSDLFDNGYEAVGLLDPRLQTVEDWRVPGKEGVVYYLEDSLVRGVLLWNTWGQVDAARDLIQAQQPLTDADLMGRLPTDD